MAVLRARRFQKLRQSSLQDSLRLSISHLLQSAPTPVLGGATPVIGGGDTPLVGARKVEVMLGLKKEAGGKEMPPPAPRNFRKRQ